jgi:hypothetical protein
MTIGTSEAWIGSFRFPKHSERSSFDVEAETTALPCKPPGEVNLKSFKTGVR